MTIRAAQQQLQAELKELYPYREAVIICNLVLERVTGLKKIDRLLVKDEPLNPEELATFEEISAALRTAKPVQYVLGEAWFYGRPFTVNEHVLIPRPETEELVLWLMNAVEHSGHAKRVLDIGTGSGCIPVTVKKLDPVLEVWSIDISGAALTVARRNAAQAEAAIRFVQLDFLDEAHWHQLPGFDFIISNPPYVKHSEQSQMAKHVIDYEPALALFVPDENALIFYQKILQFAGMHLLPKGQIFMEINQQLSDAVTALFNKGGYETELRKDLQGNDRMVRAYKA